MKRVMILVAVAVTAVVLWRLAVRGPDRLAASTPAPAAVQLPIAARPHASRPTSEPERVVADADRVGNLLLEGQVIDDDEVGVAGAQVTLGSIPPRTAVSGSEGDFRFEALTGRPYTLVARSAQGNAGPLTVRLTASSEPVILRVRVGATVRIKLVARSGRSPVPGARIELRAMSVIAGTTDAAGVVRLENVPPDNYDVAAAAAGFAPGHGHVRVSGSGTVEATISLVRGAPVAGRVVGDNGRPVGGARVSYAGASEWSQTSDPQLDGVITGARGEFKFEALPAGTFRFVAQHPERAPGSSAMVTLDGTTARSGIEISLAGAAAVAGQVVTRTGEPVPWATVRVAVQVAGWSFARARQTTADSAGGFTMQGLPRRPIEVVAFDERAASAPQILDLEARPDARGLVIRLDVDGAISGIVVDTTGGPVEGAHVTAAADLRSGGPAADAAAITDGAGRFELHGLPSGKLLLRARPARASAARGAQRPATAATTGDRDVRIVLANDGGVKGRVVYDDGSPPAAFSVRVGGSTAVSLGSADGSFVVEDVPPGEHQVAVSGAFEHAELPRAKVQADRVTDLGTVMVRRGRTISGRVVNGSGGPVAGARVVAGRYLFGDGTSAMAPPGAGPPGADRSRSTMADEGGEFVLNGASTGEQSVVAEDDVAGRSTPVVLPADTDSVSGVQLVLATPGVLEGTVTVQGKPGDNVAILAQSQTTSSMQLGVLSGADGAFRFDRLVAGRYQISAVLGQSAMQGLGMHGKAVEIVAGQTAHVDLAIDRAELTLLVRQAATGTVTSTMIYVVRGQLQSTNARDLQTEIAALPATDGSFSFFAVSLFGAPAKVPGLRAGGYMACAVPFPAEIMSSQQGTDYWLREGDRLRVFCTPVAVTPTPAEQTVEITVEVPPFVPASGG
jgi:hypothetical protein